MRLILLGSPGAGKGTQAQYIVARYNIVQISTGDMLRRALQAKTQLGEAVKQAMDSGDLIPDELIIQIVKDRLSQADCIKGFLLDGFPRTIAQAVALRENQVMLDAVIEVDVTDEQVVDRLTGRRIHPQSGRSYHIRYHQPKKEGIDDVTGEPLIQREDDSKQTVCKRLAVYRKQTMPLIKYYQEWAKSEPETAPCYHTVDGSLSAEEVSQQLFAILNTL